MKKLGILSVAIVTVIASPAAAHPGAKLLTAGATKQQSVMTPGMQFQEVAGVHLYKGSSTLSGGEPPTPRLAGGQQRIEIEIRKSRPFRQLRHMRTQGFYSGDGYASKQFTQGFYSGN